MSKRFTAYITKYALTEGIQKMLVEDNFGVSPQMVSKARGPEDRLPQYFHGRDWHRDLASAVDRAEEMRLSKIKSLKKSIAKLEALSFGGEQ